MKKENFVNEFWEYINISDFDEFCQGDKGEAGQASSEDQQLENLISKILIDDEWFLINICISHLL